MSELPASVPVSVQNADPSSLPTTVTRSPGRFPHASETILTPAKLDVPRCGLAKNMPPSFCGGTGTHARWHFRSPTTSGGNRSRSTCGTSTLGAILARCAERVELARA